MNELSLNQMEQIEGGDNTDLALCAAGWLNWGAGVIAFTLSTGGLGGIAIITAGAALGIACLVRA